MGSFKQYRVIKKTRDSSIISSFYLVPADGEKIEPAIPGQFMSLKIPGPGGRPLLRNYSLSSDARNPEYYRLTVKREVAPPDAPDAPDGIGSCYLHDQINEGDEITATKPRGEFLLDEESTRPVILLSGGVGLSPMVSMLHSLAGGNRPVWYIHACENGDVHALHDEVVELGKAENVTIHTVYRVPDEADRKAGTFDSEGFVTMEVLQKLLPEDDYEVYMCGPTPFMVAMYKLLLSFGIKKDNINFEFFGQACDLDELASES